ncbi:MAG: FGGY family carbohydrate kinase, partial [Planctomycetota bacterium]
MRATVLALDAGTTGVSALLFDDELRPLVRAYREFAQVFPRPGWVEHEAGAILAAVEAVVAEVLRDPRAGNVAALGLTNQRETVFALERSSGRALTSGIVWQDRRTEARCAELAAAGHGAELRRRTGLVLDPYFSATKIEWLLRADERLARRARAGEVLFGTVDTLILAHLTGGKTLATDPTNASRTLLYALDERRFEPELARLFGLESAWLPEVRPSVGDFGTSEPARTGGRALAIRGVAGDQQAALFGQGCFEAGTLKVTYGTGSFLLLNTGRVRRDSTRGLLTTLAVGRDGGAVYALEGSAFVCGALVQWLRDQLGL